MDSKQQFITLLQKYIDNQLTKDEFHCFFDIFNSLNDQEIKDQLSKQHLPSGELEDPLLDKKLLDIWGQIKVDAELYHHEEENSLHIMSRSTKQKRVKWFYWAAAAMLLFGFFFYNLKLNQPQEVNPIAKAIYKAEDISLITLPDGKSVAIENNRKGTLYQDQQLKIVRKENNEIQFIYQKEHSAIDLQDKINSIRTSTGAMTSFLLPDGSKVFLNSKSILRFPSKFKSDIREVELEGEGYFEVAKNPLAPFHVKTNQQIVEVLGTHFNVRAYNDENNQRTTLLEGKVKVMARGSTEFYILSPGDQASVASTQIKTKSVDTEEQIGWIKNRFVFNATALPIILKEIERWYDVQFEYPEAKLNDIYIFGNLSRDLPLQEILHVLSENTNYKFKIQERRVIMTL